MGAARGNKVFKVLRKAGHSSREASPAYLDHVSSCWMLKLLLDATYSAHRKARLLAALLWLPLLALASSPADAAPQASASHSNLQESSVIDGADTDTFIAAETC